MLPVIIPSLKPTEGTTAQNILLCPVRALKIYLDKTKTLRSSQKLLFISFVNGHTKDIQCSTGSSWIKNTIQLCYEKAGNDLDTSEAKAHNVRAFAASKAFYGGVSMDQIMQACHWKSQNTFTTFYLKDLIR